MRGMLRRRVGGAPLDPAQSPPGRRQQSSPQAQPPPSGSRRGAGGELGGSRWRGEKVRLNPSPMVRAGVMVTTTPAK